MSRINFFIFSIIVICACDTKQRDPQHSDSALDNKNSFELNNYLKLSNIYSGNVFEDRQTSESVFYRIIEIPSGENLLFFVEKISIGEEGGDYELLKRYRIEESRMLLPKFSVISIDSLVFIDSTIVSGYVNNRRFLFNLESEGVINP
jgi:hypothetical protein